jgi:hypothetical protein
MNFFPKAVLLILAAIPAVSAQAQPAPADARPSASPEVEAGAFSASSAVTLQTLETATAREDLSIVAQTQQTSTVSRSSGSGTVTSGAVGVAGNAFQNATGLTVVNANSGNNVAMNGSINVNIVMSPPAPQ